MGLCADQHPPPPRYLSVSHKFRMENLNLSQVGWGIQTGNVKFFQYNTHILMEGSKGYESAFVSEWFKKTISTS